MSETALPLPCIGPNLSSDLAAWAADPMWAELVSAFGADPAGLPDDPVRRLAWLDDFSVIWDARHGRLERDETSELVLDEAQRSAALNAADRLGMLHARPPRFDRYDHVLALGGLIRACFIRPAYAARLLSERVIDSDSFIGLGGHRPFSDEERVLAAQADLPELSGEFEALEAGVREAFGLGEPTRAYQHVEDSPGGSWTIHEFAASPVRVVVSAAPSSQPRERRANTADTYAWLASRLVGLRPGQRLLAVTTALYVPAQHSAAQRMLALPYAVTVDTVGTDALGHDPRWDQEFSATRYLMEIRSAIRGMRMLAA